MIHSRSEDGGFSSGRHLDGHDADAGDEHRDDGHQQPMPAVPVLFHRLLIDHFASANS